MFLFPVLVFLGWSVDPVLLTSAAQTAVYTATVELSSYTLLSMSCFPSSFSEGSCFSLACNIVQNMQKFHL